MPGDSGRSAGRPAGHLEAEAVHDFIAECRAERLHGSGGGVERVSEVEWERLARGGAKD